ncbi:uncharacterized protein F5891DRAFT_983217 [Suillus fuscotomentosus]|uniref:Uncharacterized protein n=1 Tax=Suillus fuscotomentosus TaxID=1912939 RepID=A0AAD4HGI6_9AGAM|nr:uncharacterized protein F5891DRAFT_983217 [Suillus fuscotomentosus]KAG1896805.1 hypothetical protein F5891DRAFT_983217 [Suillus fuscotomentosus]
MTSSFTLIVFFLLSHVEDLQTTLTYLDKYPKVGYQLARLYVKVNVHLVSLRIDSVLSRLDSINAGAVTLLNVLKRPKMTKQNRSSQGCCAFISIKLFDIQNVTPKAVDFGLRIRGSDCAMTGVLLH